MAVYSISDIEKLTGIKSHTLRMWEKRYDLVKPMRTEKNIRYYNDDDLKYLLNIALLTRNDFKISKIAKMCDEEFKENISKVMEVNLGSEVLLDSLTLAMMEMDEYNFDKIVSTSIKQRGFKDTMLNVIQPFLEKVAILWITGSVNPAQEAFITFLIRQKLIVAIDSLPLPQDSEFSFILYLPSGEEQELSLLFLHYILKLNNHSVIYLGSSSLENVILVNEIRKCTHIFTMLNESSSSMDTQMYLDELSSACSNTTILLSGLQPNIPGISLKENIEVLQSFSDTMEYIENMPNYA